MAALMKAAVPNKTTYYFDDDLAGFGFYRTTTGTGTYFAEFRPVAGGSKKRLKLVRIPLDVAHHSEMISPTIPI
ncbi:hypothetical protein [Bradyrhizobium sp. CB2312]|uniref:hypothetical protein n=1 Tax=Bradyrhizobium sp. CB2312 TaxID=3039155 RepID=UPI0024B1E191|nr:hypothetical protein [Bradyrhizobium sp. CB2312]WFU76648.1 hypothetical protein QA642_22940 [Bradyrhizobium sp. CB2312]